MTTSDITKYAAQIDPTFGFSGKHGGSIQVVTASSSAAYEGANQLIASLSIAKNTGIYAALGGLATVVAAGHADPMAIGLSGVAGVISSIGKGGRS